MTVSVNDVLQTLYGKGINPDDSDGANAGQVELPDVGELSEGETVYSPRLDDVDDEKPTDSEDEWREPNDDPRLREWWDRIRGVIEAPQAPHGTYSHGERLWGKDRPSVPSLEPLCAWYCPIHFFGHGWGIYMREQCILSLAEAIALHVDWPAALRLGGLTSRELSRHLLRAAFYAIYFHEQFHHKVESLGFRTLVTTGLDKYRPYKLAVYRQTYNTSDCLEESLANAESYLRFNEERYRKRLHPEIKTGVQAYLRSSFPSQSPGYAEARFYLTRDLFRDGCDQLQSMVLEGVSKPSMNPTDWRVAPQSMRALMNIDHNIYVVLPAGARPLFRPSLISPGYTASTRDMSQALTRHYGYTVTSGGKGSHVKLVNNQGDTLVLPGNRPALSPGVVKQVLSAFGGYPLSQLPAFLDGKLPAFVRPGDAGGQNFSCPS